MAQPEGGGVPRSSSPSPPPSRFPSPSLAMGCAASTVRAERRRRDRALGHNVPQDPVSAAPAAGRRRGCKVAPEPKEEEQPGPAPSRSPSSSMPGSPSFRFYCQKTAAVDSLVAATDADGGYSVGAVTVTETPQAVEKNDLAHSSSESSKSKEVNGWLKFRGLSIVSAVYGLFNRCGSADSAPTAAAAAAGKPHYRSAASPPAAAATSNP